ncbi:histone-fold-containing protein [Xylariales sp. AK1849]|nr:histone-fold-containing protein [Xylariales sp. AK1849]
MPRKSDTARRSDVVMAKVALAEGDATDSDAPVASAASGGIPLAPAPPPASIEMDAERGSESAAPGDKRDKDSATIEELNLPKSIITRLAKGVLPPNTQIQANAILAMSKAATVFISHLANAANEITTSSGKKTIMPQDVFDSLDEIEFPEFREVIQAEFKSSSIRIPCST